MLRQAKYGKDKMLLFIAFLMLNSILLTLAFQGGVYCDEQKITSSFLMPFEQGAYTSAQGFKGTAYDGLFHLGKDYCVEKAGKNKDGSLYGTPLYSISDGTVLDLQKDWKTKDPAGVGNYISIDHGNGIIAVYMHLAQVYIGKGQRVTTQTLLGEAGDVILHPPGPKMCPHLHLEVRRNGAKKLNVYPNLRYAYISRDGKTKLEKPIGNERDVLAWIDSNFYNPDNILTPRTTHAPPQPPTSAIDKIRLKTEVEKWEKLITQTQFEDVSKRINVIARTWRVVTDKATGVNLNEEYQKLYSLAKNYLDKAQSSINKSKTHFEREELDQAKSSLSEAQKNLKIAQDTYQTAIQVLQGQLEAGEILAKGLQQASDVALTGLAALVPGAQQVVDRFLLVRDFIADSSMEGIKQASKEAIVKIAISKVFNEFLPQGKPVKGLGDIDLSKLSERLREDPNFRRRIENEIFKAISQYIAEDKASQITQRFTDQFAKFLQPLAIAQTQKQPPVSQLSSSVVNTYNSFGGSSVFGATLPSNYTTPSGVASTNTAYKAVEFARGGIYEYSRGVFVVYGAIYTKYRSLGGPKHYLGLPITNEGDATKSPQGTTGRFSQFERGTINWLKEKNVTYLVQGAIYQKYVSLGYSGSQLGFPLSDEYSYQGGARSDFEGGSITWTSQTGAQVAYKATPAGPPFPPASLPLAKDVPVELSPAVVDVYNRLGKGAVFGELLPPNYTTRNGIASTNTPYKAVELSRGGIYEYGRGVFVVYGAIYTKYRSLGGPKHYLGLPITNEGDAAKSPQGTTGRFSQFERGTINWLKDKNLTYLVQGAIFQKYASLGYSGSQLGFPLSDEYSYQGGARSDFEGGSITWTSQTGAQVAYKATPAGPPFPPASLPLAKDVPVELSPAVIDVYNRLGKGAVFGELLPPNYTTRNGIASTNTPYKAVELARGGIYEYSRGVFVVYGAIYTKYRSLGGPKHLLGLPITNEGDAARSPQGTTGRFSQFERGTINWLKEKNLTYLVQGAIFQKYASLGYSGSQLGFPLSDEYSYQGGARSDFEGGSITWTSQTGAQVAYKATPAGPPFPPASLPLAKDVPVELSPAVIDVYNRLGKGAVFGELLPPNYTTRNGIASTNTPYKAVELARGGIYEYSRGVFVVYGAIYTKYRSLGGPKHLLGLPITNEGDAARSPQGTTGRFSQFERGTINWLKEKNLTYLVQGAIFQKYASLGYSGSQLGFPLSDEYSYQGGARSDFEGGSITWTSQTGAQVAYKGTVPTPTTTAPVSGPSISSISPTNVQAGQFTLTINGSNFDTGAIDEFYTPSGQRMGSGVQSGGLVSRSSTQIVVRENLTGAPAGTYSIKVKNSDGKMSNSINIVVAATASPVPVSQLSSSVINAYNSFGGSPVFGAALPQNYTTPSGAASTGTSFKAVELSRGGIYEYGRGVFVVYGAIYTKYRSLGGPRHYLGLPITNEGDAVRSPRGTTGRYSQFERGTINWLREKNLTYLVQGAIFQKWASLGYSGSQLGFPLSDEYSYQGGARSDFEGGSITWTSQTGAQVVFK